VPRAATKVWEGPPALRRFLVAIADLEPFPGNPRHGNIPAIRESLREFGQRKPIATDGKRIVAGHQFVTAAAEEGWTHVAAIPGEFADEDQARRFLLADNRTSELGTIDDGLLGAQLAALTSFEGTGYTESDRAELDLRLARLREPSPAPTPPTTLIEEKLLLSRDDRGDYVRLVALHKREWGLDDAGQVILRALRESGRKL
jgi:ParB-like chromosome segregation protein Spo0J